MTLIAKAVEAEMTKLAHRKVVLRFSLERVDGRLLKDVGKYLGLKAPKATIREAFLIASCFLARENKGILDVVRFDDAQTIFRVVEKKPTAIRKSSRSALASVSVLRWNLLVLAKATAENAGKGLFTTEAIINAVLEICRARLSQLFAGNGELQLGTWAGKANGVA